MFSLGFFLSSMQNHAKGGKCIIFAQSKCDISNLTNFIGGSLKCKPLHASMHQNCREETLSAFRDGKFTILVASDVAARGLHIPDVDLVRFFCSYHNYKFTECYTFFLLQLQDLP